MMNKLTVRNEFGRLCAGDGVSTEKILERLEAYEDIGLAPEVVKDMADNVETRVLAWFEAKYNMPVGRLMDLLDAHKEKRLIVLPCKEGTKVYKISYRLNGQHEINERYFSLTYIRPEDFGKTVFLTYQEAEAVLEKERCK